MSKQNKIRGKGGLRRKLLLSILPAVLVTIVVLVTVAAVVSGRRIKTMATEELSSSVENQQESIEAWLDENLQNFQSEKKAIESLSADGATIQTILDSFYGYNKNTADGIRIATASGQIYQAADTENNQTDKQEEQHALLQRLFSDEVVRSGAYKVEIEQAVPEQTSEKKRISPFGIAKAAAKAADNVKTVASKTTAGLDKVKTPFEIPDDFRCKLNRPVPKELPGWGKRPYIGFGKGTFAMSGIMMSWPVTEQESLPLSDTKGLIQQFHDEMDDHQGLIAVKCGLTPKGNRYAYVIRKMYFADEQGNQEGPTDYELNFNIRINGKIHFINGSFQERDKVPGNRSGMLYLMSLGSSELQLEAEAWDRDPYDSNREKGFLMNWTEDEKYDGLFPYHPLSEMRRFISYVVENN